jgi:hypothetical protein
VENERETGELEQLAYDLGLRALGQQERVLEELRARTGILLAATAFTASFLGGRSLAGDASPWLTVPGLMFALASIVLAVYLLAPKPGLEFSLDSAAVYEYFVRADADLAEAHRTLAYWLRSAWQSNQDVVDRLVVLFAVACACLVAAVLFWATGLGLD